MANEVALTLPEVNSVIRIGSAKYTVLEAGPVAENTRKASRGRLVGELVCQRGTRYCTIAIRKDGSYTKPFYV
jgi:hypothetical protein